MKESCPEPTQECLKGLFAYSDGNLYVLEDSRCRRRGEAVGSISKVDGYRRFSLNYRKVLLHRAVWIYHNGAIPDGMVIDHINRDNSDNRIENLRCVTQQVNSWNTGALGFTWKEKKQKWHVLICSDRKSKHVGYFQTILDARAAYLRACRKRTEDLI